MYKAFGIVSSSGRNIYVDGMQDYRPIGAFSFLGRYRVIDFPISNMTNSNIEPKFSGSSIRWTHGYLAATKAQLPSFDPLSTRITSKLLTV